MRVVDQIGVTVLPEQLSLTGSDLLEDKRPKEGSYLTDRFLDPGEMLGIGLGIFIRKVARFAAAPCKAPLSTRLQSPITGAEGEVS